LLIASDYGFKKIIGVEISQFMNEKALENIENSKHFFINWHLIQCVCASALDFILPDDNLVLYFWEPFGEVISNAFIERLKKWMSAGLKRQLFLIFLGSAFPAVKQSKAFLLLDMFETPDNTIDSDKYFVASIFGRALL